MYIKKSLKFNVLARSVMSVVELIFSVISFPYIASKLDPSNLGQIDFVNSTVAYFVTLSAFGITEYGAREVALHRNSIEEVGSLLRKLFQISLFISVVLFLIYLGIIVPYFGNGSRLFVYSSFLILSTTFNLIWALEGLEDFAYLAYVKIITKICFLAFILVFIKESKDTEKYYIGMIVFDFLYYFLSYLRLKMKYRFSFSVKDFFKKPAFNIIPSLLQIFIMILIQSSIAGIPSLFMGKLKLLNELGYLAVAQRFFWVGYYAVIPLSTVLLSRSMSFSLESSSQDKKNHLDITALSMFTLSLPIATGIFSISSDVIPLFLGSKYNESIYLLRGLSPMVVILTVINFWSMQVVFSNKGERSLVKANLCGLILMLILSSYLIPKFSALGSVIVMNVTYSSLLIIFYLLGRKYYSTVRIRGELTKSLVGASLMVIALWGISANTYFLLIVKILIGVAVYIGTLTVLRHSLLSELLKLGIMQFKKRRS